MRILYLDLDTLRPDHLGCYGYHRNTSPNIDRIAAEGIRYDNYYCSDAPCLPSRAALMSGRFGIHTGAIGHGGTCADMRLEGVGRGFRTELSRTSLPAMLKQQGFHSAYIGGFGERHSLFTFYAGFREIHDTGMGGMESAEHVTPTALDWLERKAEDDDWFLQVNYWDPHTPYRAPEAFGNPFADDPLPEWITDETLAQHRDVAGPHTAREVNMYNSKESPRFPRQPGEVADMADLRRLFDGYDCGIRYMDDHIGQLLDVLEKKGVLDDTAIVVSSDHGENMGELGIYAEHATADYITCRIPMIIRWPGGVQGGADADLHVNIDLGPTLAELLGGNAPAIWDGQSFAPSVLRQESCGREYVVISQGCHVCQRSVRWGPWLYVRAYHDGFHLFPREMLYNIDDDPHETTDLSQSRPDVVHEGAALLMDWHDAMMATQPDGYTMDPMRVVMAEGGPEHTRGHLPAYLERLRATGRGHHADQLEKRHPRQARGG